MTAFTLARQVAGGGEGGRPYWPTLAKTVVALAALAILASLPLAGWVAILVVLAFGLGAPVLAVARRCCANSTATPGTGPMVA